MKAIPKRNLRINPSRILRIFTVSGILATTASVDGAMLINNYSSAANDRFENNDNPDEFILSSFSLSGVGQDSTGRWATLIGSNTIISANHFKPSGIISFFASNDLDADRIELGLSADSQRIGNSDLWIARLSQHAPSGLTVYDIANENIQESDPTFTYRNQLAYMTGRSPSDYPVDQDQAYGTNIIDDFFSGNVSGLGDVEALRLNYDSSGGTFHESFFRSGDSGAPLLFDDGAGELLLLGINSFVTTDSINGDPVASYSSYVGNDSDQINAQIATWAAIPEPGVSLLMAVALTGFACRRTRAEG